MLEPLKITQQLVAELKPMRFALPTTHVYNPLVYAHRPHQMYVEKYGVAKRRTLLIGMNPGPFGMAQTGVPFGEISFVRDWMGISAPVDKPKGEHLKRPIDGFACTRSEVSGARLWGWARDMFGSAENFFSEFFVINYCPLVFMEESGKNRTPDKLPRAERDALFAACNRALRAFCEYYAAETVVGVGAFAEAQAREALDGLSEVRVGRISHPSPASPVANRGWSALATAELTAMEVLPKRNMSRVAHA